MVELTRSQKARHAVRDFKIITDALGIRGYYRPSGKFGMSLETCLKNLSPEIYGSMNDPKVVELKGLEYVIDRLPRGIESCTRTILTEEDPFENTSFEKIIPLKRRRISYRISETETCFIISRGLSEIYDILTHMTFLNIEANKIFNRMKDDTGSTTIEWNDLEKVVKKTGKLKKGDLDSALWNLSIILGRTYQETMATFEYFENTKKEENSNNGLFSLIYSLGKRVEHEMESRDDALVIYLTPSLMNIIGHQKYGKLWANNIKEKLVELNLQDRPVHIISANLHSIINVIYGYAAVKKKKLKVKSKKGMYDFFYQLRDSGDDIVSYAAGHGLYEFPDNSGANIDCQVIDTSLLKSVTFHPELKIKKTAGSDEEPVILVMDYAFGAQAFELMENLLRPLSEDETEIRFDLSSISIMGKAGILSGEKGDIMLATGHVFEGTAENYVFENDLHINDFHDDSINVYVGPMVTVLGTSLQNINILKRLQADWKTVGLEMEGGHYQRAVSAAILKGNISKDIKLRYAYYASDNPIMTGGTLAAGAMGKEGIKPTYMISKVILEKILGSRKKK